MDFYITFTDFVVAARSNDHIGDLTEGEIGESRFKDAGTQYDRSRKLARNIATQASLMPGKPKRYSKGIYRITS